MMTKEQAMNLHHGQEVHHGICTREIGPRGAVHDHIIKMRVSGKCQTWKTRPYSFRVPVKFGLYKSFQITETNAQDFHLAIDCPLEPIAPKIDAGAIGVNSDSM